MTDINYHPFGPEGACTCHRHTRTHDNQVADALNGRDRLAVAMADALEGRESLCVIHDAGELKQRAVEAEAERWAEVDARNAAIYERAAAKLRPPAVAPRSLEELICAALSGGQEAPPTPSSQSALPLNAPTSAFAALIGGTPID